MKNTKTILFWAICFILALASLVVSFPILLFTFYPYSIAVIALYVVIVSVLSVLSFHGNTQSTAKKRVLFGVLLVPVVTLIAMLISIEAGWLRFPG